MHQIIIHKFAVAHGMLTMLLFIQQTSAIQVHGRIQWRSRVVGIGV